MVLGGGGISERARDTGMLGNGRQAGVQIDADLDAELVVSNAAPDNKNYLAYRSPNDVTLSYFHAFIAVRLGMDSKA